MMTSLTEVMELVTCGHAHRTALWKLVPACHRSWPIEPLYVLLLVSADIYRMKKVRKSLDLGREA